MPDFITGVLLLQRVSPDQNLYRLWFQYTPEGKQPEQSYIMMREKDLPGPEGPHVWQFTRRNPWLDCSPSIRIMRGEGLPDIFHNAGQWSNHYVEMASSLNQEGASAMEVHEAINWPADRTKEQRDVVILQYRAQGVLL